MGDLLPAAFLRAYVRGEVSHLQHLQDEAQLSGWASILRTEHEKHGNKWAYETLRDLVHQCLAMNTELPRCLQDWANINLYLHQDRMGPKRAGPGRPSNFQRNLRIFNAVNHLCLYGCWKPRAIRIIAGWLFITPDAVRKAYETVPGTLESELFPEK